MGIFDPTRAPLVAAAGGLLILAIAIWRYFTNNLRHVPGPWHTRITNVAWKKAKMTGKRLHYIHALHQQYGDTVRICPDSVSVSDLDSHRQIFAIPNGWIKSAWYVESFTTPRIGVFAQRDPKLHADRRRLFAPRFAKSSLRDFWEPTIREQIALAVHKIVEEIRHKGSSDMLKWFRFMGNDIGAILMFGESTGELESGEKSEYIKMEEGLMMAFGLAYEIPLVEIVAKLLPFPTIFDAYDRLLAFGSRAVENAREGSTKRNIFHNFISKSNEETSQLTDLDLRCEATNLLTAAAGTVAGSLTWTIWSIMKRPDVRTRLEKELGSLPPNFTDADLERLSYLNAVIAESMRLYGAACGSLPREVPKGGAVLNGYALPGGIDVQTQAYTFHRREDIWEKPSVFDPSRFLRPQTAEERAAYMPYGAGSRACLGIHLAQMELRYGVALMMLATGREDQNGSRKLILAESVKDKDMELLDYFIVTPVMNKCELVENRS